jgi:hypothetical protein
MKITCKNVKFCNLGWLLTKGDVNGDNKDDLIISSPYANTCLDQCGVVGVLLSKSAGDLPVEVDLDELDWIVKGHMPYEWFGFSVKAKFNKLAVGAPQSRICSAYE